jgi:hypothetical protein
MEVEIDEKKKRRLRRREEGLCGLVDLRRNTEDERMRVMVRRETPKTWAPG